MMIFTAVTLIIACVGLTVAGLYLIKAGRYTRSTTLYGQATSAYRRGDIVAGDKLILEASQLFERADRFARWLP